MSLLDYALCERYSPGSANRTTRLIAGVALRDKRIVFKSEKEMLAAANRIVRITWFAVFERPAE